MSNFAPNATDLTAASPRHDNLSVNDARSEGRQPRWPSVRETKPSILSSEFWVFLAAVGGVLVASYLVDSKDGRDDYFRADKAWLYVVILTVGYLLSRGLAKSGSTTHSDDAGNR